jgi:hypothetical protein
MVKSRRAVGVILAGLALVAVSNGGNAQLKLAMEDRADPNPHQVALGVELAGLCLGIIVSWSERFRPGID